MPERLSWQQAQELIEKHAGPVISARPVKDGFNSEIAVIINGTTFVKGLRVSHPHAWTQECERQINPHIRHVSSRLLWSVTADGWDLNGFDFLDGRKASYEPFSPDLALIVNMMEQWPPAPKGVELKQAYQRWSAYSDRSELFTGNWLSHTDWSPSNILITNGQARMLDWAWPTEGAPWIDPACWVVWLIASGHSPAEAEVWAAKIPAFATGLGASVTAFAAAQAAMWEDIGEHAPHPGLPAAAASWVEYRAK